MSRIFIEVFEFTNFNWILSKNDIESFRTKKILTIGRLSVLSIFCSFLIHNFFLSKTNTMCPYTYKIPVFNSGTDTEKNVLNIPGTNRKHNVKKCSFHNVLTQRRFQDNLKVLHFRMANFYEYILTIFQLEVEKFINART